MIERQRNFMSARRSLPTAIPALPSLRQISARSALNPILVCALSKPIRVASAFSSTSAPSTPRSGPLPARSSWTRLPPSLSTSAAPTRFKSPPMVPAPFAPRSAGSAFISTGATRSSPPALRAPRVPNSAPAFREAIAQFDSSPQDSASRSNALAKILSEARAQDALSLWHLLPRTTSPERAQVYARFAALVPPPKGVTRSGVLNLDQSMLDLWWNSLGLGEISVWRFWEQSASPQPSPNSQKLLQKKQSLLKQTP